MECTDAPARTRDATRALDTAIATWTATLTGVTDYWTGALTRARTPLDVPLDVARWWSLTATRRKPRWHTPHEIVRATPLTRLRDFSGNAPADVVPTLVLPPQAGHDSCIVDFSPQQSQIGTIRAAGLERAFSLDWVGATAATKGTTITDYLTEIDAAIDHIGGPVNLVGDCQGGWLATIYAALRPERTTTLTIAGAPIDFHAGDAVIHASTRFLSNRDLTFYRSLVAVGNGVLKGGFLLGGFIAMKPENEVVKQLGLLAQMHDTDHVARYRHFEDWFKHTQDVPGAFYLWLVEHLFRDNELVRGELVIDDERVDLARIACPVWMIAGAEDHITPPAQVFALAEHVSTPPDRIRRRTTRGGHLGLFMGTEALNDHWPVVMKSVLEEGCAPGAGEAPRRP
jgi:poly(3-hydroxyalkanoate) synthetase